MLQANVFASLPFYLYKNYALSDLDHFREMIMEKIGEKKNVRPGSSFIRLIFLTPIEMGEYAMWRKFRVTQ